MIKMLIRAVYVLSFVACHAIADGLPPHEIRHVKSEAMGREIPVAVMTPHDYGESNRSYPIVVLLHGVGGTCRTFLDVQTRNAVDDFGFIALCPESGRSWWFDSPVVASNRFETFVSSELVDWADRTFRTVPDRRQRAIVGASMGGHGACWIGFRHPDVFCCIGNIYGGVDFTDFPDKWGIGGLLGPKESGIWNEHTAVSAAERLADGADLDIITCVGIDDFFLAANRKLKGILERRGISHTYLEIKGCDLSHSSHHEDFRQMVEPLVFCHIHSLFKRKAKPSVAVTVDEAAAPRRVAPTTNGRIL